MDLLQLREKEIFETLGKIRNFKFAVIGGYAINAYTLPRFSADCDIVLENDIEAKRIGKELEKFGYKRKGAGKTEQYHGKFVKYEKEIQKNFRVSIDIMVSNVFDRHTKANFSAKWVFENSVTRLVKGKTIPDKLRLRVISIDALIAMKFISCRTADIRDVFMLMPQAKDINLNWIKREISNRYDFEDRFKMIKDKITSVQFKNNLQGVYGYVDKTAFEKHKKAILTFSE